MPCEPEGCEKGGPGDEVLDFVRGSRLKIAGLTTFKKGAEVTPVGLEGNAHLNGRVGTVAGFDDTRKRWVVDLGDGLGKKLFREPNLRSPAALLPPPPPGPLRDVAAASGPELEPAPRGAAAAAAAGGDEDEVVDFFPGARVRVAGLGAKHGELNGQRATLVEYSRERQRWIVELEDGGRKMLREANLAPAGAPGRAEARAAERGDELARAPPPRDTGAAGAAASAPRNLRPGAQVRVEGLAGSDWEHLEGQVGVCEHCEFMTGCWTVFFGSGVKSKLRPEYLVPQPATLRPGAYVRLHGLQNARHLNGMLGICGKLDPESLRWEVHLETGESKSLKEDNLTPQDSYAGPREGEPSERNVSATFEEALQSGEISWLDC